MRWLHPAYRCLKTGDQIRKHEPRTEVFGFYSRFPEFTKTCIHILSYFSAHFEIAVVFGTESRSANPNRKPRWNFEKRTKIANRRGRKKKRKKKKLSNPPRAKIYVGRSQFVPKNATTRTHVALCTTRTRRLLAGVIYRVCGAIFTADNHILFYPRFPRPQA